MLGEAEVRELTDKFSILVGDCKTLLITVEKVYISSE